MQAIEAMGAAPLVVEVPDPIAGVLEIGEQIDETFLAAGDPNFAWVMPEDEWESLALNYVRHHRAAQGRRLSSPWCLI
jgi:fatty-acyl-CoA synthase